MSDGGLDWENLSYIATVAPVVWAALWWTFIERRENRQLEQEENRLQLQENYSHLQAEFRKAQYKLIDFPQINRHDKPLENPEAASQQNVFYQIILSLLEESFILFYHPDDNEYKRIWNSWDDYMGEVLGWKNFRDNLETLLDGEDPEFENYLLRKRDELYP